MLSNGREWRLYDNHTLGIVDVKLACVAKLGQDTFISFLEALSKPSIEQRKLEDFVRNERLYSYLTSQVIRTESDVVKAIVKVLKGVSGLSNVTAADVVGFWSDYSSVFPKPLVEPASPSNSESTQKKDGFDSIQTVPPAVTGSIALGSLGSREITGTKIKSLVLPDGRTVPITTWSQLTLHATLYALEFGTILMLPIYMSERAKSPLLAVVGSPESGRMREPIVLPAPHRAWQVEGHFSANGHQAASVKLLRKAGIDPATLQIVI